MKAHHPLFAALVCALLVACGVGCAPKPPKSAPPAPGAVAPRRSGPDRVVLVSIDTLRADYLGCYGAPSARTPNLDALASRGVRFETVISPTPLTLPSHTSLLTGLDPSQHGVHANAIFRLEDEIPTLAEAFREGGFTTAGFVASVVLDRSYGLARGFEHYDDQLGYRRTTSGIGGLAERRADEVVDAVLAWLEQAPERFFLWVHFYDPHANYAPPEEYMPDPARLPSLPPDAPFVEKLMRILPPLYAAEITYTDSQLGRLLEALAPDRRTLVAVTSDHGESLGEHGEITHSLTVYDATQRVPLLMAGGGLPERRVVAAPVRLVDVAPTLLAGAGLPALPEIAGVDLGPWIGGERMEGLDAYVETLATQLDYGWSPVLGLRTPAVKYLRMPRPELYDLAADPAELENLAPSQNAVVTELDAALTARIAGARRVHPNFTPLEGDRALLQSLGYVVRTPPSEDLALGPVKGADPKDRMGAIVSMLEASSYLGAGQAELALETLDGQPEAGGWLEQVRAEARLALGDGAAAEAHARKVVAAQPGHPEGWLVLGQALEAQDRFDEARTAYAEALQVDPTRSEAIVGMGRLAEVGGDREAAVAYYDQALAARAPNAEAALLRAALHFEDGRPYQARVLLADAWEAEGIPPGARVRLIRAEAEAGYPTRALKRLRAILDRPLEAAALGPFYQEMLEAYGARGASR